MALVLICSLWMIQPVPTNAADWTVDGDCLHAWKMDETSGTTLNDECGAFDGDISELPPAFANGKFFGGLDFTGDFIRFGDITALDGQNTFSIGIYLKTSKDLTGGSEANYWRKDTSFALQDSVDRQRVVLWIPDREDHNIVFEPDFYVLSDNEWHYYLYTNTGTLQTAYRDCVAVGATTTYTGNIANSAIDFSFGRKAPEESGPSGSYQGLADELIIVDRALDNSECLDLMNNGIDGEAGLLPSMFKAYGGSNGITISGDVTILGGN